MPFKENIKAKIHLDGLYQKLVATIKEPPGRRWLDKVLTRELLSMTDFVYKRVSSLDLYMRPFEGEIMEVVVLDNELPIYHTTEADVALRKNPYWQQMVSIRNIRKIMNDRDILVSKGKGSLARLHANALTVLDLTYTGEDVAGLLEDARQGLELKSVSQVQESLSLFLEVLDFRLVSLGGVEQGLQIFAGSRHEGGAVSALEHLLLFDEKKLSLGLKKGAFSPESDADLAWVIGYARREEPADLQGIGVFEFLAELALEKAKVKDSRQ